ncbi:MAG: carbonate dehydratase [Planctomycetota bacterium]
MSDISKLLDANKAWAERIKKSDPEFFSNLAHQQRPEYLWIGCSDSRVPANQIVGLPPGEIFVHRNVANLVVHTDLNCLSVIQFAVEVLKVKHIIVTGHYGCGGVIAAMHNKRLGQIDNWLRHVKDVKTKHRTLLDRYPLEARARKLCELNVIEQVMNVCETTVVQDAWADRNRPPLTVNGWIYSLEDGLIRDLGMSTRYPETLWDNYEMAIKNLQDDVTDMPEE